MSITLITALSLSYHKLEHFLTLPLRSTDSSAAIKSRVRELKDPQMTRDKKLLSENNTDSRTRETPEENFQAEIMREKSRAENWSRRKRLRVGNPRKSRRRRRKFEGRGGLAMEAAPRRHNITILERPPGARGGRHRGRVAGLVRSPHAAISPGDDGVGFSRCTETSGRRASARCAGAFVAFPVVSLSLSSALCVLRGESSSLCLSFSNGRRWCRPRC